MQRLQKTHLAQISSHLHQCKCRLIMKNSNTALKLRFSRGMTSCGGMVNDIHYNHWALHHSQTFSVVEGRARHFSLTWYQNSLVNCTVVLCCLLVHAGALILIY